MAAGLPCRNAPDDVGRKRAPELAATAMAAAALFAVSASSLLQRPASSDEPLLRLSSGGPARNFLTAIMQILQGSRLCSLLRAIALPVELHVKIGHRLTFKSPGQMSNQQLVLGSDLDNAWSPQHATLGKATRRQRHSRMEVGPPQVGRWLAAASRLCGQAGARRAVSRIYGVGYHDRALPVLRVPNKDSSTQPAAQQDMPSLL